MATNVSGYTQTDSDNATFAGGDATKLYQVRCRIRAVCGLKDYSGGTRVGWYVYRGGSPVETGSNENQDIVKLTVSNPAYDYYLNLGTPRGHNVALDYWFIFPAVTGATFTLLLDNVDQLQWQGGSDDALLKVPGVAQYDGIFCQVDFEATWLADLTKTTGGGCRSWVWTGFSENPYGVEAEK